MRHSDVLKELQIEDIIKFGMIPEFIGRLPVVATLKELIIFLQIDSFLISFVFSLPTLFKYF